jgi:glycosyltransferase involved in cell wall biosynthesis
MFPVSKPAADTPATDGITLSACLVVRNEGAVIRRCLQSLHGVADEIVLVHDGPCEDLTVAIAEHFGCRIFVREAVGDPEYHTVFAYEQARGGWLLTLDADEFLSPELAAVIPELISQSFYSGWEFRWPMWDGDQYITHNGPYKLSLFRRADTSLVGHLQSSEKVRGRVGRREETLHHQPLYNNFTLGSVAGKYRHWCRVQADELVRPYSELPKFNYCGPDRWPWYRPVMNALSPVLALPNGIAHFVLLLTSAARDGTEVNVRLAFYQGVYATMLQFYVARRIYLTRPLGRLAKARGRRSSAGAQP